MRQPELKKRCVEGHINKSVNGTGCLIQTNTKKWQMKTAKEHGTRVAHTP
jgi:hypothetical protein